MSLLDLVTPPGQSVAYLFPEVVGPAGAARKQTSGAGLNVGGSLSDVFIFQFWPTQVQDRYEVNYAAKAIPGASHPLYQWVGGGGRTISFEAQFVAELDEALVPALPTFNERIAQRAGTLPNTAARTGRPFGNAVTAEALPSSRYTVDVSAALAALQRYLYPRYNDVNGKRGITEPPKKLVLVLPNTRLGRRVSENSGDDGILCILMRADVTMEAFFPSGRLRAATVSLEFAEIVQHSSTSGNTSNIQYIGADAYDTLAERYLISGQAFNKVTF